MRFFADFNDEFGEVITDEDDSARISSVLENDETSKKDFQLLNKNGARQVIKQFLMNKKLIELVVKVVEDNVLTGFILKDIMKTNFSLDQIKKAIREKQEELNSVDDHRAMSIFLMKEVEEEEEETEEQKKERIGVPGKDIDELLKEFEQEKSIEKIKEHAIDKKQFWALKEDQLKDLLDVSVYGRRKKLFRKMQQLIEENEKMANEIKDLEDKQKVDKSGVPALMRKNTILK